MFLSTAPYPITEENNSSHEKYGAGGEEDLVIGTVENIFAFLGTAIEFACNFLATLDRDKGTCASADHDIPIDYLAGGVAD
ncbi:hypothetical protein N7478_012434 [Penicillium angulare]|uniref:uncharacterized protein n=1 Tax=Penicillium angulare TaxID=116970 RepID=UPI0025419FCA|nr:uncharacterized protein N7478_012434 [Penicillium angulare]KAJ5259453.1 hypothetical protein N7478_012434 [Penicillium angulare]